VQQNVTGNVGIDDQIVRTIYARINVKRRLLDTD